MLIIDKQYLACKADAYSLESHALHWLLPVGEICSICLKSFYKALRVLGSRILPNNIYSLHSWSLHFVPGLPSLQLSTSTYRIFFSMHLTVVSHPFCFQGPRKTLNTAKKSVLDVYTDINFTSSACKMDAHSTANYSGNTTGKYWWGLSGSNEENLESTKSYPDSHQLRMHPGVREGRVNIQCRCEQYILSLHFPLQTHSILIK